MIHTVCVYCASSANVDCRYLDAAYRMGAALAKAGIDCVCGAGNEGLMRNLADGCLDGKGTVIGVIPQFMVDNGWAYNALTQTVVTADIHTRKERMAAMADAAIALPGGCGTLEELLEIVTWRQLGLFAGRIIVVNTGGYYDPLLAMLSRCVDDGFMKPSHRHLWEVAETPEQAAAMLMQEADNETIEPKRGKCPTV